MAYDSRHVRKMTWIAVGAIVCLLAAGVWSMWYSPEMLSGDGTITDGGSWSYPRYTVTFPHIEIVNDAHAKLHVKGLPRDPMTFTLRAITPERSNAFAEVDLTGDWVLTVGIRDDQGLEIYGVSATLSDWQMQQSGASASLWHESLRAMSFIPEREYTIDIQVSGPTVNSGTFLEPQLAGGGNELP